MTSESSDSAAVLATVAEIIRDALELPDLEVDLTLVASDIEEWDSMAQLMIVLAVEAEFGCEFDPEQLAELGSVEALVAAVADRR